MTDWSTGYGNYKLVYWWREQIISLLFWMTAENFKLPTYLLSWINKQTGTSYYKVGWLLKASSIVKLRIPKYFWQLSMSVPSPVCLYFRLQPCLLSGWADLWQHLWGSVCRTADPHIMMNAHVLPSQPASVPLNTTLFVEWMARPIATPVRLVVLMYQLHILECVNNNDIWYFLVEIKFKLYFLCCFILSLKSFFFLLNPAIAFFSSEATLNFTRMDSCLFS